MPTILDLLTDRLGADSARQIGSKVGSDEQTASRAMSQAIPVLLAALARNSSQRGGAEALMNALDRDHDGSALDDISGLLGGSGEGAGDAILGHIFGDKRPRVESAVGRTAGLDARQVGQIMAMLAPLVMGALGKVKRQEHLDAKGLSGLLQGELQESRTRSPASLGLLGSILDSDRDGDVDAGDVARTGFGFLGKFFGKR